ncbi:hypothetical protein FEE59_25635, partial [Herbaspirillum sp. RU 5E]|nr:hypothetical protein [Herbaspirillum sp. RU 5E]
MARSCRRYRGEPVWWHRHRGSRGKGGDEEVKQVNSHVDAGNKLSVVSGSDTTISGAVLRSRQVDSTDTTRVPGSDVSTSIAKHSLVKSS